ncbi:MAG: LD-carboxypeptidase [Amycolatopsis sp.]|uniref:S66 peptidase family protein n=1 Tax=Amycolatopsis sp. TaxID=37632 RepID=UPI002605C960|nr:LD-carboxypeptidase [Amycolatopsis sp.]MCU1680362.1 LD-carboxypeptidase [Amycolatopsis sp.]
MRPPRLARGATIALVAPAGPVPEQLVDAAVPVLESWGVRVRIGDCVRAHSSPVKYLSASDERRAAEFSDAWLDPDVGCVLAARGGYGSMRMLDLLDWTALAAAPPKVFAGSSDVTALHEAIGIHCGLTTLFSPMPASTNFDDTAAEHLRQTLFEPEKVLTLTASGGEALRGGAARGKTLGGNLALVTAGIGAPEHVTARGAIAVLEDVTESIYRIDRMLTQLLRSGWFDGVAGIVLGSWTACGDLADVRALMVDRLVPLGVPVRWEFGFGHLPSAPTVPLGVTVDLDADAGTLTLAEPALA